MKESKQEICKQTATKGSELGRCAVWSGHSLSTYAQMTQFYTVRSIISVHACVGYSGCLLFASASLRKHAYSNILKILPPKNENFQIKIFYILHISDQNIDCEYSLEPPRRGGSNEYPQSMFLSRNKKNYVYPCKPQFYYIKLGFKGVKIA